ncbi:MAG TPA: M3 family metallopeptidase [Haliangium sp.]|nr:M3 family metallopeptidase [Haliangium sp.]
MRKKLRTPLLAAMIGAGAVAAVTASCSTPSPRPAAAHRAPAGTGIDWKLAPAQIASSCKTEIQEARARLASILAQAATAQAGDDASALARLVAIETSVADMHDALVAQKLLGSAAEDAAVRDASAQCHQDLAAFQVELSASPAVYELAQAARARAATPADQQLAKIYVEAGRRAGAGLDPARRAQLTALFDRLSSLQIAYMQAIGDDLTTIEISTEEAASLSPSFVRTLQPSPNGYLVPVNYGTLERFLDSQSSGEARKRYFLAFYNRGGRDNLDRLEQALALRDQIAQLLGFESWAAYRLDAMMARTPERAIALLEEIGARLLPRAREEIRNLAQMKSELGDGTPFAAWDYPYYEARLEETRFGVNTETVREHFPVDAVVRAVLDLYGRLLGVTFQPVSPAHTWAPGVLEFAIIDNGVHAGARPIGWFFLDLHPRPGKGLHYSHYTLRTGRALPDGSYRPPIAAIMGNGPAAEPGKPALLSHKDVIIFFHEFGHLMHATLSTAPYATLHGTNVRGDFVEAPSQMFESWMWEPSILKKVSSHVATGAPLPDALIASMIARKHVADGAFWTRQVFFGVYDMTLHSAGPDVDTTRLWLDLTVRLTALSPVPGTIPQASFAGFMGGYDAGYYGYLWSKVYAQDMFTEFERHGLENPDIGMRYRREILEPGGTREPDDLLGIFLGRSVSYDAFYEELGLAP